MLPKIKVQTPDGMEDYLFIADGAAFEAAKTAGEISPGMSVVYRGMIVYLLEDCCMLAIAQLPIMSGMVQM